MTQRPSRSCGKSCWWRWRITFAAPAAFPWTLVNSTTGLSALHNNRPLKVLGRALFDLPGLTFQGSLSYLDFQYKQIEADAIAGGVRLDSQAPYTPEWRWSADVAYEIPL